MNEVKAWDGEMWKVGEKVGYKDINLMEYEGVIVGFISANMCNVKWTRPTFLLGINPSLEYIPNLRRLK